jgi:hypothetical protein
VCGIRDGPQSFQNLLNPSGLTRCHGGPAGALIALEKKWVAALQRSDTKALSALWAQRAGNCAPYAYLRHSEVSNIAA